MDTPDKSQIAAPLSKFEDSPVFNYINSLSPIKPVKSINIAQTFHSLSFASLPSVFTSPHVSSHKESRFLVRHNRSDPLLPDSSSENGNNASSNEGVVVFASQFDNSTELQENFDPGASIGEASVEPTNDEMKFAIELPHTLKYDCGSPDCDPTPASHCGAWSDSEASEKRLPKGELHFQRMHQFENKKEVAECDWESLITDAADLLIFNSPTETEVFKGLIQKSLDHGSGLFPSLDEGYKLKNVHSIGSTEHLEIEDAFNHPGESIDLKEKNATYGTEFGNKVDSDAQPPLACKVFSNLQCGMRRRCLDFELVGARKKNLYDGSCSNSSIVGQSDKKNASNEKQSVPIKPGGDSSRHILPGIGLHLNALALTSKDSRNIEHETSTTGINLPGSDSSLHSLVTDRELDEGFAPDSGEEDTDPTENAAVLALDVPRESSHLASEGLNLSSPKKKRRRLEGETEACKRCNCKKSKCLKLYCECFAAGVYCIEPCSCRDCFNKPIHEDTVLATRKQIESRNPLAFAPKVIRSSEDVPETGDEFNKTPASARHKRGCNCKKSNCTKKYCECFQGGVGCSINCRCEGCKNAFGRKDGSASMEAEAVAEDETERENSGVEKSSQETEVLSNEEQNPNSTLPITPSQLCRPLMQLPFSSISKPPRPFLGINSSTGLYSGQKYGRPSIFRSQAKFDKQFESLPDNDMPEILQGNNSPTTGIRTCSPNSKRISPPHGNLGSSPRRSSGRKLILQSIPSFPPLTPPASK